jgi:hypothetical protein
MRERAQTRASAWCWMAVAVLGLSTPALAADATGNWKWTVERNGNTFEQTLKLKQEGSQLTGSISGRQGNETAIEDGKVADEMVSFKVTRMFGDAKVVFTYQGKLSGDEIKGTTKFDREGETQSFDWNAKRAQ